MPTYQYACTECEHAFEQVQSFSDDALTTCPACTGRLRKVFNAVGVVFKGSGFYRTDSRAGAGKGGSASEGGSGSSGSGSSGSDPSGSGDSAKTAASSGSTSGSSGSSGSSSSSSTAAAS